MNISGIRPSAGFYSYNTIDDVRKVGFEPKAAAANTDEAPEAASYVLSDEEIAAARSRQVYDASDYAQEYRAGEIYELKGAASDLRTLDVQKAISDMQKDDMLSQYQYFVGDKPGMAAQAARGEEDFQL